MKIVVEKISRAIMIVLISLMVAYGLNSWEDFKRGILGKPPTEFKK